MSALVGPPFLLASGAAIGAAVSDERLAYRVEGAVLGAFLVMSTSLYCNASWTRLIVRQFGADTGRDWLLNSGVLRSRRERTGPGTYLVATAAFLTSPLWIRVGRRTGRRYRPRAEILTDESICRC